MKIVRPFAVTSGVLTTSATNPVAAWNSGTTYSAAQQASKGERIWSSVAGGNLNKDPESTTGFWVDIGPINTMAMFDDSIGTQTEDTDTLAVTVAVTGRIDTLALLNMDAAAVNVTVMDGATEEYNEDFSLTDTSAITDWYAYFFEEITRKTDLLVTDLPNVLDPDLTVTITGTGTVLCGHFVAGVSRELGGTEYGASVGITDYSRKTQDEFGNWSITERGFSKRGSFKVFVENTAIDFTHRLLSQYRAVPVMVIGADEYAASYIFGLLKDWSIDIAYVSHSIMNIEMEGLT